MKQVWFVLSLAAVSIVVWSQVSGQIMAEPEMKSPLKKKKKKDKLKKKKLPKKNFPTLHMPKEAKPVAGAIKTELSEIGLNQEDAS